MIRGCRWLLVAALLAFLVGCSTTPYTGRTQLMMLGGPEEMSLGQEAYQKILSENQLSNDVFWVDTLRRVGNAIAVEAEADVPFAREFQWEFNLIASDQVNAFCLPGGKVAFYTGILPICQDEAGLAVVMGHEVAHAVARHGAERVSQGMLAEVTLGAAHAALSAGGDEGTAALVTGALGAGLALGVLMPYGREHESEADRIGLILMAKAGYDPREAPRFWERMAARAGGEGPPEFLSTHPSHDTRIQQLNEWMDEALQHYQP